MTEHVFEVGADVGSVAITSNGVRFFFANGYGDGTHKCVVCDADENFDGGLDIRADSPERHWLILKNKLTGRHGKIVTLFDSKTGTFRA